MKAPKGATQAQKARQRACRDRIRAYVRNPGLWYHVWSSGRKYIVWYDLANSVWHCTCKSTTLCKHLQRVRDREKQRIRREALAHAATYD